MKYTYLLIIVLLIILVIEIEWLKNITKNINTLTVGEVIDMLNDDVDFIY